MPHYRTLITQQKHLPLALTSALFLNISCYFMTKIGPDAAPYCYARYIKKSCSQSAVLPKRDRLNGSETSKVGAFTYCSTNK